MELVHITRLIDSRIYDIILTDDEQWKAYNYYKRRMGCEDVNVALDDQQCQKILAQFGIAKEEAHQERLYNTLVKRYVDRLDDYLAESLGMNYRIIVADVLQEILQELEEKNHA